MKKLEICFRVLDSRVLHDPPIVDKLPERPIAVAASPSLPTTATATGDTEGSLIDMSKFVNRAVEGLLVDSETAVAAAPNLLPTATTTSDDEGLVLDNPEVINHTVDTILEYSDTVAATEPSLLTSNFKHHW